MSGGIDHDGDFDPSTRGFLPSTDPLDTLERADPCLNRLDELAKTLPTKVENNDLRPEIRDLDAPDEDCLDVLTGPELRRVYSASAMLASAYRHNDIVCLEAGEFDYDPFLDPDRLFESLDGTVENGERLQRQFDVDRFEELRTELNGDLDGRAYDWDVIEADWVVRAEGVVTRDDPRTDYGAPIDAADLDPGAEVEDVTLIFGVETDGRFVPKYDVREADEALFGYDYLGLFPARLEIPSGVADPLCHVAEKLGVTPFLSYDAYVLYNWTLDDPEDGFDPENVRPLTTFTGTDDEAWFISIHASIEGKGAEAVEAATRIRNGFEADDVDEIEDGLTSLGAAFGDDGVVRTLSRMGKDNDPSAFREYRRFFGAFELDGDRRTEYEGHDVEELTSTASHGPGHTPANLVDGGVPKFRGASGAQTALFPALDAALSVGYIGDLDYVDDADDGRMEVPAGMSKDGYDAATALVSDLHRYMPPEHRSFIESLWDAVDFRRLFERSDDERLRDRYDRCIDDLVSFRGSHFGMVREYITDTSGSGETDWPIFLKNVTALTAHATSDR